MQDSSIPGRVNILWARHAELDLSEVGYFRQQTFWCAALQELALDAPKTGWKANLELLRSLESAQMPRWAPERWRGASPPDRFGLAVHDAQISKSAMGQLFALQEPSSWVEEFLAPSGPQDFKYPAGCSLAKIAQGDCGKQHLLEHRKTELLQLWREAVDIKKKELQPENRQGSHFFMHAVQKARDHCNTAIGRMGLSFEGFALLIYEDQGGEQDCWDFCFEELCALFAKDRMQQASLGALRREPLTVAWFLLRSNFLFNVVDFVVDLFVFMLIYTLCNCKVALGTAPVGLRASPASVPWIYSGLFLIFFNFLICCYLLLFVCFILCFTP
ncbi:unnamed protein product [Polarella glacialis]|nr:unnamed protein product [Polarella glacialis]